MTKENKPDDKEPRERTIEEIYAKEIAEREGLDYDYVLSVIQNCV